MTMAVIGSTNKSKIIGAVKALRLAGVDEYRVLDVDTGVEQPLGLRETLELALYRALKSIESGGDYGIGIEGGVLFNIGYPIEGQVAVVVDSKGFTGIGFSSLFPLPRYIGGILSVKSLGEVMSQYTGVKDVGKLFGAVGYLSLGYLTRIELSFQATLTALMPFIRRDFYKKPITVDELKEILKTLKL